MAKLLSFLGGTLLGYILNQLVRPTPGDAAALRRELEKERRLRREQEIRHHRFRVRVALGISKAMAKRASPLDESRKKR